MIKEIKKAGGDLLILDAGDLLFKRYVTPSLSASLQKEALLDAKLMVEAFNLMGCDAVGIGDYELTLGAKAFAELKKRAKFPFVSSNVIFKDGRRMPVPYVIKRAGGLRWGIFSLLSANLSSTSKTREWKVLDPLEKGREVVKKLKKKADLIILLADMPLKELRALLSQLQGIAIVVAGHSSSGMRRPMQVGQTIVVRSYGLGRYLGMLDLYLKDPKASFVDEARIMTLERDLAVVNNKIKGGAPGNFEKVKAKMEAQLRELKRGNIYRNQLILLSSRLQEDKGVKRLMQDFSAKKKELKKRCPEK
ncbi:MAG: hypothetical protein JRI46_03065 [Deltaproteobacteria bacterium]|nr:hypothetical protein [Deltaproteobacteria bacterium]